MTLRPMARPDGGMPEQLSAAGRVQSRGEAVLDAGEAVLAVWTHVSRTRDAGLARELWPFLRRALAFTAGLLNATTGWAEALRFGPQQPAAAYCSAPQGKAVNALECGARLCAAVGAGLCPDGGRASPGRQSHSDTTLYISLVIIYTKYTGWRQNDSNVHV